MKREITIQGGILNTSENYKLISINIGNKNDNKAESFLNIKNFTRNENFKLIKNNLLVKLKKWVF